MPNAPPEMHLPKVATDDRYCVPFTRTVGSRPLRVQVKDNSWADIQRLTSASLTHRV